MKTPLFLMSGALLLWGWQAGFLIWAILMAVVLESARFSSTRWEFSDTDFNRFWDLCTVLFLGVAVLLYASDDTINRPFLFAQWQPFIFLPMMLAQAYASRDKIPLRSFSWFLRRSKGHPLGDRGVNISYLYFAVCILGASASNRGTVWFYPAVTLIVSAALLATKPRRFSFFLWATMLAIAGSGGYFAQRVLHEKQAMVETMVGQWLMSFFRRQPDFRQSRTSIGQIGAIKLSGKIVWRVRPMEGQPGPNYLRETTYDSYRDGYWLASKSDFVTPGFGTNDIIQILEPKKNYLGAVIAGNFPRGRGVLPMPHGVFEVVDLPAAMETNALAVARVKEGGPTFVNFMANYGPGVSMDGPTNDVDLALPENEKSSLTAIVQQLDLDGKSDEEKIQAIGQFFQREFGYSIYIGPEHVDPSGEQTPLSVFLTKTRSGHCEYFATATVLLLRAAGIPARYATGYAVDETSNSGKSYTIRERHAHAWTLVYRNGYWENFDTTPASWTEVEGQRASAWEIISDFFSRLGFEFSKWRWSKTSYTKYLIWLLIPLVLFLAYRIIFNKQRQRAAKGLGKNVKPSFRPGLDSEFYLVERKMADLGVVRSEGETLAQWRERASKTPAVSDKKLTAILALHQRYRFDPNGLNPEDRQQLKKNAEEMLAELDQRSSAN